MPNIRQQEGREFNYVCGRCGLPQDYLPDEPKPTCTDCFWPHFEMKPSDIPAQVKLVLNDYN